MFIATGPSGHHQRAKCRVPSPGIPVLLHNETCLAKAGAMSERHNDLPRGDIMADLRFLGNRGDSCRKSSFPRPSRASQRRRARYSSDGAEDRLRRPWCIVIVSAAERYFTETADLKPYSFFAILLPAFGPNLFFLLLAEPPWHRRRPS